MNIRLIPDTEDAQKFKTLIDLIPIGITEAIAQRDLKRLLNMDTADLKKYVLDARKAGILICSGDAGYYFPANLAELREYYLRRRKYIHTALIALHPFRQKVNEMTISAEEQTHEGNS